jgi:poly-gamma-glutamate synthesis protein (capsule biosynthesis protein)
MAGWLAEKGADLIRGSHPNVPQTFESVTDRKVPVAYSLGNAVSNMSAANTQMELMATIRIIRHNDGTTEVGPIGFTYLWCSRPGGYGTSYTIIPIRHFIDRKNEWKGVWDYEKMLETYNRVKKSINIEDR